MARERRALGRLAALLAAAALGAVLWRVTAAPSGPVEPAWDKVACARCRMLVSDPRFAAQLRTASGVRFYDDPGCLLLARAEERASQPGELSEGAAWFHDSAGDGWLAEQEARFVAAAPTPMGHGLAAVAAAAAPEGLDAATALAALRARPEPRP
jgi:copper chaperone NosL